MVGARIVDVGAPDGDAFDSGIKTFEYEESSKGKIDSLSGVLMIADIVKQARRDGSVKLADRGRRRPRAPKR
jgi:hypothetical protein